MFIHLEYSLLVKKIFRLIHHIILMPQCVSSRTEFFYVPAGSAKHPGILMRTLCLLPSTLYRMLKANNQPKNYSALYPI